MYFNGLNYTLANEDTRIEREVLSHYSSVITIAGSGARVLPLLKPSVSQLDIIDISENQLKLTKLRLRAAKSLSLENYQEFFGYKQTSQRKKLFSNLDLDNEDRLFWQSIEDYWIPHGFIFIGKWENHLRKLGVLFRKIFTVEFEELFELSSIPQRREWMQKNWPRKRLQLFLNAFANPWMFNLLLYRGHFAKGEESVPDFLMRTFETMLVERNPRESFFMQMLFLGELKYSEGFPVEVQPDIYKDAQNFQGVVRFQQSDLVQYLQLKTADFVSLSDVPSYMTAPQIRQLEEVLSQRFEYSQGAWVARSFLSHPRWDDHVQKWLIPDKNSWAESCDTTGVYKFHIFESLEK